MATLNTRIVIRNDSSVNWLTNKSAVLLKGEIGIEFLADAVVKKHTHANATVLDGISAEKITAWDAAIQSITANTGLKATKSGTDITIDFDNSVTFIFNCGDSAI